MNTCDVSYRNYFAVFYFTHIQHAGCTSKLIGKVYNDKMTYFETVPRDEH